MTKHHPTEPRLIFDVDYHPAEKKEGEWNYSLGVPPKDEWYEIKAVAWDDGTNIADITDFMVHNCDHLFAKWEESLVD